MGLFMNDESQGVGMGSRGFQIIVDVLGYENIRVNSLGSLRKERIENGNSFEKFGYGRFDLYIGLHFELHYINRQPLFMG